MKADAAQLGELTFWRGWQAKVKASLPLFCADTIYVEQASAIPHFEEVARSVLKHGVVDDKGRLRDAEFGGLVVKTQALGEVTRMWLDANVEVDFLRRNLPGWTQCRVLDIGAGYGRLAVVLSPLVKQYVCVDAVPVSTDVCTWYCARFAPSVLVWSLHQFLDEYPSLEIDLAINIHSWNECPKAEVRRWLDVLAEMAVPWLFTVSHGRMGDTRNNSTYYTWERGGQENFRAMLLERYELVAEESIGLGGHPHALWHRK